VPELRRVGREALHATLCFLGDRPLLEVDAIGQACEVAAGRRVGQLALAGVLWLPARRRPNVLAVGIADPHGELGRLEADLAGALAGVGAYSPGERAYLPHVTVARVRGRAAIGASVRDALEQVLAPADADFDAAAVTLFRSHLGGGPGGRARYERLRSVPLRGS
jgi:2'-5' RNA ligase